MCWQVIYKNTNEADWLLESWGKTRQARLSLQQNSTKNSQSITSYSMHTDFMYEVIHGNAFPPVFVHFSSYLSVCMCVCCNITLSRRRVWHKKLQLPNAEAEIIIPQLTSSK